MERRGIEWTSELGKLLIIKEKLKVLTIITGAEENSMKRNGLFVALYALLVLVGGLIGYLKAHSVISLYMSSMSSALLLISALLLFFQKRSGLLIAIGIILVLDGFFTFRWVQTGSFLPSGLFSVLSTVLLLVLALRGKK